MASAKTSKPGTDGVQKALVSIGVDKGTIRSLASSKAFGRVVVPIYWKDGMVTHVQKLWIQRLPEFLRGFNEEFPDGQVRWDDDYEGNDPSDDAAIRVYFNYQEDDQGDHWSPPPTLLEEESYGRMLSKAAFKGKDAISAGRVLHEK